MEPEKLRQKQSQFEGTRQERQGHYKNLRKLQKQFVQKFPIKKIRSLEIDDYVEGKRIDGEINTESFCYWVEWKTSNLGRMQGARADKFGLYCDKKTQQYKFLKKFEDENKAFNFLKGQIIKLIKHGRSKELENIKRVELSPMFKGKILFLYFPDKFINIFAERHVDYFLEKLDLLNEDTNKLSLIDKREVLFNFKNNDEFMKNWSMFEYSNFLYTVFGRPAKREKTPEELRKYIDFDEDYPKISRVTSEFIKLEITSEKINQKSEKGERIPYVIDFEKENKRNKRVGDQGESIVLKKEREYLRKNGKASLASQVKQISKEDTSAGYDILSFDLDGREKYIEVKATSSSPGNVANFIITNNEYEKAKELENYYLYIVFEVKTEKPKIWKIKNPASLEGKGLFLRPLNYRALININRG